MTSLLVRLPLPGSAAAYRLWKTDDKSRALDFLKQYNADLMSSWLGRRVIVAVMEREKSRLNVTEIEAIWLNTLTGATYAEHALQVWRALAKKNISLTETACDTLWKVATTTPKTINYLRYLAYRVVIFLKLSLETVSFYFGIGTKDLFAARSLWDMQHRYDSLRRLTSLLTTISLGAIQSALITPSLIKWLNLSGLFSTVLLTTAVALVGIAAISLVFYGLKKLIQTQPLEIWRSTNLTHEASMGYYEPLIDYDDLILHLSKILSSHGSSLTFIRGEGGTGKTSLLKEFARRLTHNRLPADLGKPQLFLIGSGSLKSCGYISACEQLDVLRRQIEGFEKNTILAFDEAHLLEKESVEALKSWLEKGIRIIFITNSQNDELEKQWGNATFESLMSHTRNSEVEIKGPFDNLLQAMIERTLKQNPELRLSPEAIACLVEKFKDLKGPPRLLANALKLMVTENLQEQNQMPQRIALANRLTRLEQDLDELRATCQWKRANEVAITILQNRSELETIEQQVDAKRKMHAYYKIHFDKIAKISALASKLAQASPSNLAIQRVLETLQTVLPKYLEKLHQKYSTFASYPIWDVQRVTSFCPRA